MPEKKSRPPKRPDTVAPSSADERRTQRDAFVQTFFKKGAEFTEELLRENLRLRAELQKLEHDNTTLRTQLKSDNAIREALKKIEHLEKEKEAILSQFTAAEAVTSRFTTRYSEIEEELSNLANLYVASYQLHSTMRLPSVVKHLHELLQQLVGASAHAIYLADEASRQLVAVAADGIDVERLPRVHIEGGNEAPGGTEGIVERVFLTGVPHVNEGDLAEAGIESPAACVPMKIDDRAVGVIVIYHVLPQKARFVAVDFELFKMLAAHAATALAGAMLFAHDGGRLPGLDVFPASDPQRSE